MGFFNDLSTGLKLDEMRRRGIRRTDDVDYSCLGCIYWENNAETCTYHGLEFNGSSNTCSHWKSK